MKPHPEILNIKRLKKMLQFDGIANKKPSKTPWTFWQIQFAMEKAQSIILKKNQIIERI